MKKILAIFFVLTCMNMVSVAQADNYSGTLNVQVEGSVQPSQQSTVVVTKGGNTANLQINNLSILNYVGLNISLNCAWLDSQLGEPADITVTPSLIAALLGKLQINQIVGELNDNNCKLNLKVYSPNLRQNIDVSFDGAK